MTPKTSKPETLAAQAMGYMEPEFDSVIPPIHMATTYKRAADLSYPKGAVYGRDQNPGYGQVEDLLTHLEGGAASLVFASGMAAATAPFLALTPGAHVLAPKVMYWALRSWLTGWAARWGIRTDFYTSGDLDDMKRLARPGETKLIWMETPSNPMWDVTDIAGASDIAKGVGAYLICDSTVSTPAITRPIEHGADAVMHSATKYLNGHSDVLAGTLTFAEEGDLYRECRLVRKEVGNILGAVEAWLLLRGMRTLYVRVKQASANALAIAEALQGHNKLEAVLYPGLERHPNHDVARRQMTGGFGGMLSIRVKGGMEAAVAVSNRLKLFVPATSLGGVESLVEHRASIEGPDTPVPDDLLRLSVGIEDTQDLIADLRQALDSL
ncbi:MAG: PLP-dependent aspartate aminotransferase family protein [Alphaproteobacteria bacterium]|nr:PLP-dependent aspartate aminotransferase family protein [Alphaproteobacteria bacterium]